MVTKTTVSDKFPLIFHSEMCKFDHDKEYRILLSHYSKVCVVPVVMDEIWSHIHNVIDVVQLFKMTKCPGIMASKLTG